MSFRRIQELFGALPPEERRFGELVYYDPNNGCRCAVGALLGATPGPRWETGQSVPSLIAHFPHLLTQLLERGVTVDEAVALQAVNDSFWGTPEQRYERVVLFVERALQLEERGGGAADPALLEDLVNGFRGDDP